MNAIIITGMILATCIYALDRILHFKYDRAFSDACACGHAAAFHKETGGCDHRHTGSTDCYGQCTCQRTANEVTLRTLRDRVKRTSR